MKFKTEDLLKSNGCNRIEQLTARQGVIYEFYYNGRYRYMKELNDQYLIDGRTFNTIIDMIEYFNEEELSGLKPLSERKLFHKYANSKELRHAGDWIDYYVKYLSVNHLNHSEEQIRAFYDWRYALTEYHDVPRYNLVK